jgi:two-component system CheB/CheR fusion protein
VLPLCESTDFGALHSDDDHSVFAGLRLLAVDDTADTLEVLKMLLEFEGATVKTAQSAQAAIDLLKSSADPFDLVLSDIGMPGMDGYQLIRHLRAIPGMAEVPAVALTGYGRTQDAERALQSGFSAHLGKPIEIAQLRALLHGLGVRGKK